MTQPTALNHTTIRAGGLSLVAAAVGFTAVFIYLAARFNYPDVLDTPAAEALPALLAMGTTGRAVWAVYGLLPLLLLPAAVGAFAALRRVDEDGMRLGLLLAAMAAISMMLGLLRWPSIQWELAQGYADAGPEGRAVITAIFDGLNRYLGNYLGEFVGELSLNGFFVVSGRAMLRDARFPRWVGWAGVGSGVLGLIAMWRNVTPAVDWASALDDNVLPLWMIVFGVALWRYGSRPVRQ
jgi:hypothetical protein